MSESGRARADKPLISLTMIVKNEEANIGRALDSARGIADEMIVVDTGSTDRTVEIARGRGARVIPFTWVDDFSAARNFALDHATGEWILILDGDDVAVEESIGALRAEIVAQPAGIQILRVPVRSRRADGLGFTVSGGRRLFRNSPEIRWIYPIHENIVHCREDPDMEGGSAALVVEHSGYADTTGREAAGKHKRNLRLLRRELRQRPDAPELYYYLAVQHAEMGHHVTALRHARAALRRFAGRIRPDFAGLIRVVAMRSAMQLGQAVLAVRIGELGVRDYAYSDLCFTLGCAHGQTGNLVQAERFLNLAMALRDRATEFQVDAGSGSWKALVELGTVAWSKGNFELAIERWRRAYDWMPNEAVTNLALGRGLLANDEAGEALDYLRRAAEAAPRLVETHTRYCQALVATGQNQAAYDYLDDLTRRNPDVSAYWLLLGDLLHRLGEHEECARVLGGAIDRHQTEPKIYILLGSALRFLERHHDSLNAFVLAARLDPGSIVARNGMRAAAESVERIHAELLTA